MRTLTRCLLPLMFPSVVAGAAVAGVVVVDPGGGAAALQAALDAAQSGDILLLHGGDYTGAQITVSGKGVVLVAESGQIATLSGMEVLAVPAGQTLLLSGLEITSDVGYGLSVSGPGSAWIQDVTSLGPVVLAPLSSGNGLHFASVAAATVVRSALTGGDGVDEPSSPVATSGGNGIEFVSTRVTLHETVATGGRCGAGAGDPPLGPWGGDGVHAGFSDRLSILGGMFTGGDEPAGNPAYSRPGYGMSGSFLGAFDHRAAEFAAGTDEGGGPGVPDILLGFFSGPETVFPAALRSLRIASPVRELQPAAWTVHGETGDQAFVMVSATMGSASLPGKQGTLVLGTAQPLFIAPLGTITDPAGALGGSMPMPRLPPGVDGLVLYTQLSVVSAQGEPLLGTGNALVWLSALL